MHIIKDLHHLVEKQIQTQLNVYYRALLSSSGIKGALRTLMKAMVSSPPKAGT